MIVIVILLILCVIVEGFIIISIREDYRIAALELKLLKDAMEWRISKDGQNINFR